MGLNKQSGNMYEFVTHTWNPIKGECYHDCSYCYMKRWGKLKPVHIDRKELKTDLGLGNFIFIGSSCDIFALDINQFWIDEIIQHCNKFDNTYLFQTKNPLNLFRMMERFIFPDRTIICTTIETNRTYPDVMKDSPEPHERLEGMMRIRQDYPSIERYVTIEPIMDFDSKLIEIIKDIDPVQVNIGADSSKKNLPEPSKEKILALIVELEKFTKVMQKYNLKRLLK